MTLRMYVHIFILLTLEGKKYPLVLWHLLIARLIGLDLWSVSWNLGVAAMDKCCYIIVRFLVCLLMCIWLYAIYTVPFAPLYMYLHYFLSKVKSYIFIQKPDKYVNSFHWNFLSTNIHSGQKFPVLRCSTSPCKISLPLSLDWSWTLGRYIFLEVIASLNVCHLLQRTFLPFEEAGLFICSLDLRHSLPENLS